MHLGQLFLQDRLLIEQRRGPGRVRVAVEGTELLPSEEICERSCASAVRLRVATAWRYCTKAVAYRFATRDAWDGIRLAAMVIMFVWPTCDTDTAGALFS